MNKSTYSRNQLIEMSVPVFMAHPETSLFATADGQFFILSDRAQMHARKNSPALKVYEIDVEESREVATKNADSAKNNTQVSVLLQGGVKSIKAAIVDVQDVEQLKAWIAEEQNSQNRSTAIKAIQDRIDAIEAEGGADAKPEDGADTKPEDGADAKPEGSADVMPEGGADAKPEDGADANPLEGTETVRK